MNRRDLLKSLPFLFLVRGKPKFVLPEKGDPWPGDPIGTIVRNPSNIIWKSEHRWVRKFGAIPYPKGCPYYGTCDYYWERIA